MSMTLIEALPTLTTNEKVALFLLKKEVLSKFPYASMTLYGSKVKGNFDAESDIDILILLDAEITREIREHIILYIYDLELEYDVIISPLVESFTFWKSPEACSMPINEAIKTEGIQF
jgi:uncharacterized protein